MTITGRTYSVSDGETETGVGNTTVVTIIFRNLLPRGWDTTEPHI